MKRLFYLFFLINSLPLFAQKDFDKFISNFPIKTLPITINKTSFTDSIIQKYQTIEKAFVAKFLVNEFNEPFDVVTQGKLTYKYFGKLPTINSIQSIIILTQYIGFINRTTYNLAVIRNNKIDTYTTIAEFRKDEQWETRSTCNIYSDLVSISTEYFNLKQKRLDTSRSNLKRYNFSETGLLETNTMPESKGKTANSEQNYFDWARQLGTTRTETVDEFVSNFPTISLPFKIDTNFFFSSVNYTNFSEKILTQWSILNNQWIGESNGNVHNDEFSLRYIGKYSMTDSLTAILYLIKNEKEHGLFKDWHINLAVLNSLGQISSVMAIADGFSGESGNKIFQTAYIDNQKIVHCLNRNRTKRKEDYKITDDGYELIKYK